MTDIRQKAVNDIHFLLTHSGVGGDQQARRDLAERVMRLLDGSFLLSFRQECRNEAIEECAKAMDRVLEMPLSTLDPLNSLVHKYADELRSLKSLSPEEHDNRNKRVP